MQGIAKILKKVDKHMIKVWDLELMFFLCNVQISITGNKTDPNTSNQAMFDFGISNQKISLRKQKHRFLLNAFGVTISTYQPFLQIFKFAI